MATTDGQKVEDIKLSDINISKYNVRKNLDEASIKELADSIKEYDQLQPVVLMRGTHKHELIVGQRRYLAIKSLKRDTIKAIFIDKKNAIEAVVISLAENLQRSQLTYEDMSNAINTLYDHYKDAKKVAKILGTSLPTVYEYVKIEKYVNAKIKDWLTKKKISKEDVKRAILLSKGDKNEMEPILREMVEMTSFQKNRAVSIAREHPKQTGKLTIQSAKKATITDILTLNLSTELTVALAKAKKELREDGETIAMNALQVWLADNGFLK